MPVLCIAAGSELWHCSGGGAAAKAGIAPPGGTGLPGPLPGAPAGGTGLPGGTGLNTG